MQAACRIGLIISLLVSCAAAAPPTAASGLSAAQKAAIGKKIWQNECGGSVAGLTTWNAGEEFPSLGIGHFIWYPAGIKGRFSESWPQFVEFARKKGEVPPKLAFAADAPWSSKAEFQKASGSGEMTALRSWLAAHVTVQTEFIIARSHEALPKMLAAAPASERTKISDNFRKVSTTPQGTYALIDYVNFKGEGTEPAERYNGQGWGLMQVLGHMNDVPAGAAAATEFAASAKRVLSRRIANSPPARGEKRWEEGWHNRCATYARPL